MSGDIPAWAAARSRADFMRVASTQDGAGDILLQSSYTETKNYYVSNSPLHFAGEATRSETETHRSRLGNRSWADDVYREALSNASPSAVLLARENLQDKPYYAEYRTQALENITNDRFGSQTFVTYANMSRMQPDEIETVRNIVSTNPAAAKIVFGQDPNGGYSRRSASDGPYSPEIMEAAARNMAQSDPRMAEVLARDSRYASYFEEARGAVAPAAVTNPTVSEPGNYRDDMDVVRRSVQPQSNNPTNSLGIDSSDGYNAREKQAILEAAGFATDGGRNARADGQVDGKYGAASRAAEQQFSAALVGGQLGEVNPEVLRMAREAFSPSITNAVNMAATEAAVPASAAGVTADRGQSAER